jgi:hypothetical protein
MPTSQSEFRERIMHLITEVAREAADGPAKSLAALARWKP